ncbi:MAG: hypothetical protein ACI8ZM_002894 [Crocinitomix sp.]
MTFGIETYFKTPLSEPTRNHTMKKLNLAYFIAFTIVLIAFNQNTFAQDSESKQLKLYSNFGWESAERTIGFDTVINVLIKENYFETSLGYFSPAFSWATPKGNRHEIELSRLQFNQVDEVTYLDYDDGISFQVISGERNTNVFIALRYEFDYQIIKNKDSKLKPSLGFAVRPYYSHASLRPKVSSIFSSSELNVAAMFSIVPRLNYDLNKKMFIDLSIPLSLAELGVRSTTWDNPAIPVNQRTVSTFVVEVAPSEYLIRLGIGIRL